MIKHLIKIHKLKIQSTWLHNNTGSDINLLITNNTENKVKKSDNLISYQKKEIYIKYFVDKEKTFYSKNVYKRICIYML